MGRCDGRGNMQERKGMEKRKQEGMPEPEKPAEGQQEYQFLKESIKKKVPDKKKIAKRAGIFVGAAVLFGMISALVFAIIYPRAALALAPKPEQQKVALGADNSSVSESSGLQETQESEIPETSDSVVSETAETSSSQETEKPEESEVVVEYTPTIEDMESISEQVVSLAQEVSASLVTVIGITEDRDWFNETYENQGQLTGLVIARENRACFILTEYRVVKDVDRIMVTFCDGTTADARYISQDPTTGLAVIRVMEEDMEASAMETVQAAELGSSVLVKQGQPVLAMGSPMGYSNAVAFGFITSIDNSIAVTDNAYTLFTTDIKASEDGSGFLVDMKGRVIGVMQQKLTDSHNLGLVSVLPMSEVQSLIEKLCNNEELVYVGMTGQEVGASVSEKTGIPKGIWVESVVTDSPAMESGIQVGDVIISVDDTDVTTLQEFHKAVEEHGAGQTVKIIVMRQSVEGYVEIVFDVTIEAL